MIQHSVCKTNHANRSTRFCFSRNVANTLKPLAATVLCALAAGAAYGQEKSAFSVVYTFNGGADGALVDQAPLSRDKAGNIHGTTYDGGNPNCAPGYGCGVVFQVAPDGTETTLYNFLGSADNFSHSGVVSGPRGDLYGSDQTGPSCCGSVFKLDSAGVRSTLFTFNGTTDGSFVGGVIRDARGNLYGTTEDGGDINACGGAGCGVVFKLDPDGNYTILHTFEGAPSDGQFPTSDLLRGKDGSLYGTTTIGGSFGNGTVFKIDPNGAETVLYSFSGAEPQFNSALIEDQEGNLYGVTGFQYDIGAVFKLDPQGNETVLYQFTGGADGGAPSGALLRDRAGNLYGTAEFGGNQDAFCEVNLGCGVVFKVDPKGNETVLYTFTGLSDGDYPGSGLLPVRTANGTWELYGAAQYGGNLNCPQGLVVGPGCGTIFKISLPAGTEFDPQ